MFLKNCSFTSSGYLSTNVDKPFFGIRTLKNVFIWIFINCKSALTQISVSLFYLTILNYILQWNYGINPTASCWFPILPKQSKNVLLLSSMHNSAEIQANMENKKPHPIHYYQGWCPARARGPPGVLRPGPGFWAGPFPGIRGPEKARGCDTRPGVLDRAFNAHSFECPARIYM